MNEKELADIKQGSILWDSWGYDCTIHDFAEVLEVGRTIKAQTIGKKHIASFVGGEQVEPDPSVKGHVFRIRISRSQAGYVWLVGSYPFSSDPTHKRRGSWSLVKNEKRFIDTER